MLKRLLKENKDRKVISLSDTDLDGYSCQFLLNKYHDNVVFRNIDNGPCFNPVFMEVLKEVKRDNALLIITDTSVPAELCSLLVKEDIDVVVYDHHPAHHSYPYSWYNVDKKKCATKMVFEALGSPVGLKNYVEMVNSIDIYKDRNDNFQFGAILAGMIKRQIIPKMFDNQLSTRITIDILDKVNTVYPNYHPNQAIELELNFNRHIRDVLGMYTPIHMVGIQTAASRLIVDRITADGNPYVHGDYIIVLDAPDVSVLSGLLREKRVGSKYLINIRSDKFGVGIRSLDTYDKTIDCDKLAKQFFNGGGHKAASGGRRKEFLICSQQSAVEYVLALAG